MKSGTQVFAQQHLKDDPEKREVSEQRVFTF